MSDKKKILVFVACSCIEALAVAALQSAHSSVNFEQTLLYKAALYYNIIPLSLTSFIWLLAFGHGAPSIGPLWLWHAVTLLMVFLLQVAITTFLVNRVASWLQATQAPAAKRT